MNWKQGTKEKREYQKDWSDCKRAQDLWRPIEEKRDFFQEAEKKKNLLHTRQRRRREIGAEGKGGGQDANREFAEKKKRSKRSRGGPCWLDKSGDALILKKT